MLQSLYKKIFWLGYTAVLIVSVLSLPWQLDKIHIGSPEFYIRLDHLLHIGAYFLICMYYLAGKHFGLILFEIHPLRKLIILTSVLATVTEFIQLWVPTRSFNIMDWVANVTGILLGTILIKIKDSRLKIKEEKQC